MLIHSRCSELGQDVIFHVFWSTQGLRHFCYFCFQRCVDSAGVNLVNYYEKTQRKIAGGGGVPRNLRDFIELRRHHEGMLWIMRDELCDMDYAKWIIQICEIKGGAGKGWSCLFLLKYVIDLRLQTSTLVGFDLKNKKYLCRKYSSGFPGPKPISSFFKREHSSLSKL